MMNSECVFGDCMDYLPLYKKGHFGTGLLDTQYGIKEDGRNSKSRGKLAKSIHEAQGWDDSIMSVSYWVLIEIITDVQIIFGANYIQQNIPFMKMDWGKKPPRRNEYEEFLKRNPKGFIIWDKVNGSNDFSDCEIIYVSVLMPSFVKYFLWNGMMQGYSISSGMTQQGNKKLNQKRIHPTEKPIILLRWLLQTFGVKGKIVLDTHSGSQSGRIASLFENFQYLGYETHMGNWMNAEMRYKAIADQYSQQGQLSF